MGDAAERAVSDCFPDEWIVRKEAPDYGIDLSVEIVRNERVTGTLFSAQVKGVKSGKTHQESIRVRLKASTINYWRRRPERVMLAAHVKDEKTTYWTWTDEIPKPQSEMVTFHMPHDHQLSDTDWTTFLKQLDTYYHRSYESSVSELRTIRVSTIPDEPLLLNFDAIIGRSIAEDPLATDCGIDVFRGSSIIEFCGKFGIIDCGKQAEGMGSSLCLTLVVSQDSRGHRSLRIKMKNQMKY